MEWRTSMPWNVDAEPRITAFTISSYFMIIFWMLLLKQGHSGLVFDDSWGKSEPTKLKVKFFSNWFDLVSFVEQKSILY